MYFQPKFSGDEIIEDIDVILTLNCRVDSQEEGLTLINNKMAKTYVGPNGSSTIDLILMNMKGI